MKLDIFAKHRTGKRDDGSSYDFYGYTTRLVKKDGELITAGVKFTKDEKGKDTAPYGPDCPCSIIVDKKNANLEVGHIEIRDKESGDVIEVKTTYTLWVKNYEMSDYVDKSLDEFEFE